MSPPLQVGTPVQYTNAFLYSTRPAPTGDACFHVGEVVEICDDLFVRVRWSHDPHNPRLVRSSNIARTGSAKSLEIPSWVHQPRAKTRTPPEQVPRAKARATTDHVTRAVIGPTPADYAAKHTNDLSDTYARRTLRRGGIMSRKSTQTETQTDPETEEEPTPKRVVHRKPLYVLIPTGFVTEEVAPVGDEENVRTITTPTGHKLLGKVNTKKEVGDLLSKAGIDATSGIEHVLVVRGTVLPIKLSTQVIVRF